MGVGAAERISKVRWQVGREMIVTWLITIPVTGILSAALFMLLRVFTP
jgi:PiT family inorganic phosphate transporter